VEYAAGSRLDAVRRYEYGVRAESAGATEALALALAFDAAMSQEEKRSTPVGWQLVQSAVVKLAAAAACVCRVGKRKTSGQLQMGLTRAFA
jgi:hypothetical protein